MSSQGKKEGQERNEQQFSCPMSGLLTTEWFISDDSILYKDRAENSRKNVSKEILVEGREGNSDFVSNQDKWWRK